MVNWTLIEHVQKTHKFKKKVLEMLRELLNYLT